MSTDGQEIAPNSPWEITRFEFVYFDPLHKRWQIWQEAPLGLEPLDANNPQFYRRQFHQLLRIIRKWFAGHLGQQDVSDGFQLSNLLISDSKIVFETHPDAELAENRVFWERFLDHCAEDLKQYGVRPPEFLQEPTLRQLRESKLTLHSNDALNLISVLPILRDWDLFGCWYRAWTGLKAVDGAFPSLRGEAGSWTEPFYMARFRRTGDLPNNGKGEPLPYEFLTQAACCDLAAGDRPQPFPEKDFFSQTYCPRPGRTEDLLHYRAYAYLYDRLQESLTKKALIADHEGSEPKAPPSSYLISYPVTCVGRIHFLQIQVTTLSASPVPVEKMWSDWMRNVHVGFWTAEMKQFLSEELQRIKLSTFQALWSRKLGEESGLNPDSFVTSLCLHAPILVPVRAITYGARQWAYRRADWKDAPDSKPGLIGSDDYGGLGAEWAECPASAGPRAQPAGIVEPISWVMGTPSKEHKIEVTLSSRTSDNRTEVLTIGRAGQVFEQQITVGVQAMESIRVRAERARIAAQAAVHAHFVDPQSRERFRTDPEYVHVRIAVPVETFSAQEMPLNEVFAIGWPNKSDRHGAMEQARRWTIPLQASQVLAVGPVKAMTHRGGKLWWDGDWAGLRTELEKRRETLIHLDFPREHEPWMGPWKQSAIDLVDECLNACPATGAYPDGLTDVNLKKLSSRYRVVRIDANPTDFQTAWDRAMPAGSRGPRYEFTKPPRCSFYCPFPSSSILEKLHTSIKEIGEPSGIVTGGAEAIRLFSLPVDEQCPWKGSEPYLYRNIVHYRYEPKETVRDGDIQNAQVWKDLHELLVREYCDVVVGSVNGFHLLHSTPKGMNWNDAAPESLGGRNNKPGERSWFDLGAPNEIVVAFLFDTWRTSQ